MSFLFTLSGSGTPKRLWLSVAIETLADAPLTSGRQPAPSCQTAHCAGEPLTS